MKRIAAVICLFVATMLLVSAAAQNYWMGRTEQEKLHQSLAANKHNLEVLDKANKTGDYSNLDDLKDDDSGYAKALKDNEKRRESQGTNALIGIGFLVVGLVLFGKKQEAQ